jgi:hypothetical protein
MTTRELATYIYYHIHDIVEKKKTSEEMIDDKDEILFLENLMITHFEIDNVLGAKGFVSISKESNNYGC